MKLVSIPSIREVEEAIGIEFERWAYQCHSISHAIVQAGLFPEARVARGSTPGVGSQHSWVVLGNDCYDPKVMVVDPTLWSYVTDVTDIWSGAAKERPHTPHGAGSIWAYGAPPDPVSPIIDLAVEVSGAAQAFLRMCSPVGLDRAGWAFLAHAPVEGWPAAEIVAAMDATPDLSALVPIDILGMLTDVNPNGLYLRRYET